MLALVAVPTDKRKAQLGPRTGRVLHLILRFPVRRGVRMGPFTLDLDSESNSTASGVPTLFKNPYAWTTIASMSASASA